jgi:hypothetical protein
VSTTGEDFACFERDAAVVPPSRPRPAALRPSVDLIAENCEPALCTVLFMAGAGGGLRSGVTRNPVRLTQSVQADETRPTCSGAPVHVWPGGGITVMVDATRLPPGAFGDVPTPTFVAPLEFTLPRAACVALGGHEGAIRPLDRVMAEGGEYPTAARLARAPGSGTDPVPDPVPGSAPALRAVP